METPRYLIILWRSKWLLLVGLVIATLGGLLAGFTLVDGQVVPRSEQAYRASTTVLVSSQTQPMYQAVIPGQEVVEGQTLATDVDLTQKAILYAYMVSGLQMRDGVADQIGELSDTEDLTSLRRTTQPGGDESFPGRYVLPIIDVVGASTDPDRAEQISATATDLFLTQVAAEQEAAGIPEAERVVMSVLDESGAVAEEGSNPMIPVLVTFLGIFLLFVAAAFLIAGAKGSRERKRAARDAAAIDEDEPGDESPTESPRMRRGRSSALQPDPVERADDREPTTVG